ncbi:tail fiber protein [Kordiimonas sp. SCSIO 12603]|uniref:phage tail protein n=1 Tax=Kordiimonas sp. SCSIO 12603 TaxID=2829596 RepID=UPI002107DE8D|nr:tail fiber protein [Kordiimonas sp. SCSIO 12603]UTW57843.1 tail fiber protein [Kordiimonas sp. SCSIO 12603]
MEETFIGVIEALGFQFAPRNWAYCSGQTVAISQQSTLFSLIGTFYGGDGRTTFMYPDLRGRTPIGQFQGIGLTNRVIGQKVGGETITLTISQMPTHSHAHTYTGAGSGATTSVEVATTHGTQQTPSDGDYIAMPSNNFGSAPEGNLYVTPPEALTVGTVEIGGVASEGGSGFDNTKLSILDNGGGQPFEIMQPTLVINYCICVTGIYPSRS